MIKVSSPQQRIFDVAERVMLDCSITAEGMVLLAIRVKVNRQLRVVGENSWPSVYRPILVAVINQASGK
jgi:hypothetical protein